MKDTQLGVFIKKGRINLGISQRELSRRSMVDIAEISRIESGLRKKPNVLTLVKIAFILEINSVTLMKLAGYTNEEIDMYNNYSFTRLSIENNDPLIKNNKSLIKENIKTLKKEKIKLIVYKHILAILNKDEFLNSDHYNNLNREKQEIAKEIYDDYKNELLDSINKIDKFLPKKENNDK